MHVFQHHVREMQRNLADAKRKAGLQYLYDKQDCETNENAFFADMRLRESENCFDPSFSLPGLETATAPNAPSLSDNEYEEVFKQFTAFPDSEDTSTGNESLNFDTELRPINDEPLEVWPIPLPLPVPIAPAPEHSKANARTRSMMDEVRSATRSRALLRLRDNQSHALGRRARRQEGPDSETRRAHHVGAVTRSIEIRPLEAIPVQRLRALVCAEARP